MVESRSRIELYVPILKKTSVLRAFSFIFTITLSLVVMGFGSAAIPEAPAVSKDQAASEFLELSYDSENPSLLLDLYLPARSEKKPFPLIVLLHGGCFTMGHRTDTNWFAKEFQRLGFAAATVSYRLAPEHFYPTGLEDIQQAVRFLRKNADLYHLNPNKIGAMGFSAGGYLAAALGVRLMPSRSGQIDEWSPRVQAVVDHYGRTDFTLAQRNPDSDCAEKFLGLKRRQNPKAFEEASIIPYVSSESAVFQIAHGTKDQQVIPYHSEILNERLLAAGTSSELILIDGAGHGFTGEHFNIAWKAAVPFFNKNLK